MKQDKPINRSKDVDKLYKNASKIIANKKWINLYIATGIRTKTNTKFVHVQQELEHRACQNRNAKINKKMIDDVKVILAEYRLALKIYNTQRNK